MEKALNVSADIRTLKVVWVSQFGREYGQWSIPISTCRMRVRVSKTVIEPWTHTYTYTYTPCDIQSHAHYAHSHIHTQAQPPQFSTLTCVFQHHYTVWSWSEFPLIHINPVSDLAARMKESIVYRGSNVDTLVNNSLAFNLLSLVKWYTSYKLF